MFDNADFLVDRVAYGSKAPRKAGFRSSSNRPYLVALSPFDGCYEGRNAPRKALKGVRLSNRTVYKARGFESKCASLSKTFVFTSKLRR